MTTSSAEAEYIALGAIAKECDQKCTRFGTKVALSNGIGNQSTIPVKADNQGAIKMAKNNASGNRTKHINICFHLVRNIIKKKKIATRYCPTTEMVADILSEPIAKILIERFRRLMGLGI